MKEIFNLVWPWLVPFVISVIVYCFVFEAIRKRAQKKIDDYWHTSRSKHICIWENKGNHYLIDCNQLACKPPKWMVRGYYYCPCCGLPIAIKNSNFYNIAIKKECNK